MATDVVVLTADDFEKKVVGSEDTWLVEFYAPVMTLFQLSMVIDVT